ncbi:MAG: hypothetical protein ABH878_04100, partial [bacterium]
MKKLPASKIYLSLLLGLCLSAGAAFAQLSVHDVQYTTDPSGNSPYKDSTVTVQGVVTAVEFSLPPLNTHSFFIADTNGGAWSGLLIASSATQTLSPGDWVQISGLVKEQNTQTLLQSPTVTLSGTASLPQPAAVTTQAFNQEAYEGVLIALNEVWVTTEISAGVWRVTDASAVEAKIGSSWDYLYVPSLEDTLDQVKGIGVYMSGSYRIEPRDDADLIFSFNIPPVIS